MLHTKPKNIFRIGMINGTLGLDRRQLHLYGMTAIPPKGAVLVLLSVHGQA